MSLDGKVVVVLGATGAVGSELVRRLAARGAKVVACARNPEKLNRLQDEAGVQAHLMDATVSEDVEESVLSAAALHGRVDGLASCVGTLLLKPTHAINDAEWDAVIVTNLSSAFYALRAAAKVMRSDGRGGSVVLVSSAAAGAGLANQEATTAAMAGVAGLAVSAAATYAPHNICVNCVAQGLTETALASVFAGNEVTRKAWMGLNAMGQPGRPADAAAAIEYLLDPANRLVTGQVLAIGGGIPDARPD